MLNLSVNDATCEDIDLMIFDKDGTLFQLYPYCSKMVFQRTNAICDIINDHDPQLKNWLIQEMGVDLKNQKIFPEGPIGVYSKYYAMDLIFEKMTTKGYEISKNEIKEAYTNADEVINTINYLKDALVPVEGMIEFIEAAGTECKMAIFSNDMTDRLKDSLDIFNIGKHFDHILGGDLVAKQKPDPMGILMIMDKLKVSPGKTAFFGDSVFDVESGKKAKCKYIFGVLSDISDEQFLKSNQTILIDNFNQITVNRVI